MPIQNGRRRTYFENRKIVFVMNNEELIQSLIASESSMIEEEEQLAINFIKSMMIYANDEYDKPRFTLSKNGIGFAPLGNIMAICAQMKMGKSWLMQQMACAILKGEFMGLKCELDFETSVLYVDTEQDKYDTQMALRRVQYVCGWDFKTDNNRFQICSMRDFDLPKEWKGLSYPEARLKALDAAIKAFRPTVVFIDGVRDLIEDFNSLPDSAELVQHLMTLSTKYDCCIWSVLHVNPNSEKMRGHLGTELGNKTTDVFTVHKGKDEVTGEVTFEVKQVAARHRDVDDWLFRIDDSKPFAIPFLLEGAEANKIKESDLILIREMMKKYIPYPATISQTALQKTIKAGERIGSNAAYEIIKKAEQSKIIERAIDKKFMFIDGNPIAKTRELHLEGGNDEIDE